MFYAAGPPEARVCVASRVAVVGGGNSAGQAAVWLAKGGALVTLLHRRADLRVTTAAVVMLCNLFVDLLHAYLSPRIRSLNP